MTRTHLKTVAVVTNHDQPKLSKGQQAFNKLIKQIEKSERGMIASLIVDLAGDLLAARDDNVTYRH